MVIKIKQKIVTNHNEVLYYWGKLIQEYRLSVPFEVVHIDSYADLGLGYPSWVFILDSLLSAPAEERMKIENYGEMFEKYYEPSIGDYLLFALAFKWIRKLVYVCNLTDMGNDYVWMILKDGIEPNDKIQLENCGWDKDMVVDYYTSLANGFRYTCLSNTDENNMPMWAYYANNHQGFCVEYLLCDMQKKYIFPVTLQMLILSLAAKHKSWEHEREYRIICHRDDFPAIPSKIYIGLNCKEEYRKELIEVGRSIDVCKVYQMEFDEDSKVFG